MGMACARQAQWRDADRSFQRAIQLNRSNAVPYYQFAFHDLFPTGRTRQALQQLQVRENLDPLDGQVHYQSAYVLMAAGRSAEAEVHCNKLSPEFSQRTECLAWAKLYQGKVEEVILSAEASLDRNDKGTPCGQRLDARTRTQGAVRMLRR